MNWQVMGIDEGAGVLTLDCPGLDWDSFPVLAETLVREWELELVERDWGADRHSWQLAFEGSPLRLEYAHHSGCWLEAVYPGDGEVVLWLGHRHSG